MIQVGTDSLENNFLTIIGDPGTSATLHPNDLNEIVEAVRDGFFDKRVGERIPVTKLIISQYKIPRVSDVFSGFITSLLAIPHLTLIDFSGVSNWNSNLKMASSSTFTFNNNQTTILADQLAHNSTITHLAFNAPETRIAARAIAHMISENVTLKRYRYNLTDDCFAYLVLKAALRSRHSVLTFLGMPYTCLGWSGECRLFENDTINKRDIERPGLTILGEGSISMVL